MMKHLKMKLIVNFFAGCLLVAFNEAAYNECAQITHDSPFAQHQAPDANQLWKLVGREVRGNNNRDQVQGINVTYAGQVLQAVVGTHAVRVTATTVNGADKCYDILVTITDTDECTVNDPKWSHSCHSSANCENFEGSYNCVCPKNSGTFGKLFSGSSRDRDSAEYATSPGMCHGYGDTELCCGVSSLHEHTQSDKHQLSCHTAQCIENCRKDFVCDTPCNAITEAVSPRAKLIGEDIQRVTSDMEPLTEYQDLRRLVDANGWKSERGWRDQFQCLSDITSASFQVACFAGMEPSTRGAVSGQPLRYEWVDRTQHQSHRTGLYKNLEMQRYKTPTKDNVNLKCSQITIPKFCDPRDKMQCPCNCNCVDADDYNKVTGLNVPLGKAYYCLPDDGFIAIEPMEFKSSLVGGLEEWYSSTWPPRHIMNTESPGHRNDTHMCVDRTPPAIRVARSHVELHQCDAYHEADHPEIIDKNKNHEFNRRMGIHQSPELYGVDGYLQAVGKFTVDYTVESPWLEENNKVVSAVQTVTVSNTNECGYQGDVDVCRPKCFQSEYDSIVESNAICTDVVMQDDNQGPGYLCSCPEGYTGNAFESAESFNDNNQKKK